MPVLVGMGGAECRLLSAGSWWSAHCSLQHKHGPAPPPIGRHRQASASDWSSRRNQLIINYNLWWTLRNDPAASAPHTHNTEKNIKVLGQISCLAAMRGRGSRTGLDSCQARIKMSQILFLLHSCIIIILLWCLIWDTVNRCSVKYI